MDKYCVCGKRIPIKGDLCRECLSIYGTDPDEWPLWLSFQIADIRRENDACRNSHEETFSDLFDDVEEIDLDVIETYSADGYPVLAGCYEETYVLEA